MPRSVGAATGLFNLGLLAQHRVDIEAVQQAAEQVLPRLTRGTPLANHWAVNPSNAGATDLRVVLFRSDAATNGNDVTKAYADSCQTSIPFKLIICDVHIFEGLMHRWGFDRTTDLGGRDWPTYKDAPVRTKSIDEQAKTLSELVTWVLGHEIGHLSVKSTETTADVNSLLSEVSGRRLIQTTEVLADQHVFHGSGLLESERQELAGFLVSALNAELHLKYCPTGDVVQLCSKIPAGVGIIFDYNRGGSACLDRFLFGISGSA